MGVGQDLQHASLPASTRPNRSDTIEPGGTPEDPASARTAADSCEGVFATGEIGVAAPGAPFASDHEINISDRDRIALSIAPPSRLERRLPAIITGTLLSALGLGLGLGWIVRSKAVFPSDTTASLPLKQLNSSACSTDPGSETVCVLPKADRRDMPRSLTSVPQTTTGIGRALETTKAGSQVTNAIPPSAKQNKTTPGPTPADRARTSSRPVPETRPTTIEGWTVRTVDGGTAVLEGPTGTWRVARGDTVPGVGKVDSIVRWGNHWIVATSRALISSDK
jgi:hypothetical protein